MFNIFSRKQIIEDSDKITFLILSSELRYKYSFDTVYRMDKFTKHEIDKLFFDVVKILYSKFVIMNRIYNKDDLEEFELLVTSVSSFEDEVAGRLKKDIRGYQKKLYRFIEVQAPEYSAYKILFGYHMDFTP